MSRRRRRGQNELIAFVGHQNVEDSLAIHFAQDNSQAGRGAHGGTHGSAEAVSRGRWEGETGAALDALFADVRERSNRQVPELAVLVRG